MSRDPRPLKLEQGRGTRVQQSLRSGLIRCQAPYNRMIDGESQIGPCGAVIALPVGLAKNVAGRIKCPTCGSIQKVPR